MLPSPPIFTLFPYTTLFRSRHVQLRDSPHSTNLKVPRLAWDFAMDELSARPLRHDSLVEDEVCLLVAMVVPKAHPLDRKSTRLNSSHVKISYAVFCLKKKKK